MSLFILLLLHLGIKSLNTQAPWGNARLETWTDWLVVALELCGALARLLALAEPSALDDPWSLLSLAYVPIAVRCLMSLVRAEDFSDAFACRLVAAALLPGNASSRALFASAAVLHAAFGVGRQAHALLEGKSPKTMLKILVLTIGTRGDVQPFVALGQELQRRGHAVTICAFEAHKDLVLRHGLAYASAGLDGIEQDAESWRSASHVSQVMRHSLPDFTKNFVLLGKHFYEAAQGKDVLVAVSTTQSFAFSIAEKLGLSVWVVKLAPDSPTRAFAPPNYAPSWLGIGNYVKWLHHWALVAFAARAAKMGPTENEFRKSVLGLKPLRGGKRIAEMFNTPTLCAFSPTVVPAPRDWGGNSIAAGWFYSSEAQPVSNGGLARDVDAFLRKEGDVVCITFGSMFPAADGARLVELIVATARAACTAKALRVLIIRPPGDGHAYAFASDVDVLEVDEAPHSLVFPRCRLVVHHGGAGTTASVLESGTPAIVVPILVWTDQPLWGERVQALGCAVHVRQDLMQASTETERAVRRKHVERDLALALGRVDALKPRCEAIAARLRGERGVQRAAELISLG